jgi:hypothetical protein
MKLILAFAAAVLTVAGPSLAQDQAGMAIPRDATTPLPGKDVAYRPGKGAELMGVRYELRRACAADLLARCPGKDGAAADRCLEYHRLNFTLPCRKAITAFERAASRRPYDTLATYAPISGPIPPPDQRPEPAHPTPRTGSGD